MTSSGIEPVTFRFVRIVSQPIYCVLPSPRSKWHKKLNAKHNFPKIVFISASRGKPLSQIQEFFGVEIVYL
jgi:hypothetical protein